jgi:hypothetical protein
MRIEQDIADLKSRRDALQVWFAVLLMLCLLDWGLIYLAFDALPRLVMVLAAGVFLLILCAALVVWVKLAMISRRIAALRHAAPRGD